MGWACAHLIADDGVRPWCQRAALVVVMPSGSWERGTGSDEAELPQRVGLSRSEDRKAVGQRNGAEERPVSSPLRTLQATKS